jgi:hypothetical protein
MNSKQSLLLVAVCVVASVLATIAVFEAFGHALASTDVVAYVSLGLSLVTAGVLINQTQIMTEQTAAMMKQDQTMHQTVKAEAVGTIFSKLLDLDLNLATRKDLNASNVLPSVAIAGLPAEESLETMFVINVFNQFELVLLFRKDGLITDSGWEGWEKYLSDVLRTPQGKKVAANETVKSWYSEDFRKFLSEHPSS